MSPDRVQRGPMVRTGAGDGDAGVPEEIRWMGVAREHPGAESGRPVHDMQES